MLLAGVAAGGEVPPPEVAWTEVEADRVDMAAITERGRLVLRMPDIEWKHAQTDHFVIHYEQAIFARKVARMAEFFYAYITSDLRTVKDRVKGRSHIFVFRSPKRWEDFRQVAVDVPEWTFSRVEDTVLFLQQAEDTQSSGSVLAHEMTHLVVNRFFIGQIPLWLNEGLAEFYGEFGYSAFKGVKKSRRAQFTQPPLPYSLTDLFNARTYPLEEQRVAAFYQNAKYVVAMLLIEYPVSRFEPFMSDLMSGGEIADALGRHYKIHTMGQFEKQFRKFAH